MTTANVSVEDILVPQPVKAALSAFVGSTIEWYDFYLFATAASLLFGRLFFPAGDPMLATIGAMGTFAVGFIARPFGAVYLGSLGDRLGRKRVLVLTMVMMGVATVLIGLLPNYQTIGVAAPVLLVALRVIQGFSMGGEWGGAVLIAAEHSKRDRSTFNASFAQLGNPAGMILCLLAVRAIAQLNDEDLYSWGWRLPFLVSAILILIGLWVRSGVRETPAFETQRRRAQAKPPVTAPEISAIVAMRRFPKLMLLLAGANTVSLAGAYLGFVFMLTYTTHYLSFSRTMMLDCLLYATILQFCLQPIGAWIANRVGTGKFLLATSLITVITPFVMYPLVNLGTTGWIMLGLGITILFNAGFYASMAGFSASLFPIDVRYSAISMSYQGCAAVAGALAPIIAALLLAKFPGNWVPLAITYGAMSAISAGCIARLIGRNYRYLGDQ